MLLKYIQNFLCCLRIHSIYFTSKLCYIIYYLYKLTLKVIIFFCWCYKVKWKYI